MAEEDKRMQIMVTFPIGHKDLYEKTIIFGNGFIDRATGYRTLLQRGLQIAGEVTEKGNEDTSKENAAMQKENAAMQKENAAMQKENTALQEKIRQKDEIILGLKEKSSSLNGADVLKDVEEKIEKKFYIKELEKTINELSKELEIKKEKVKKIKKNIVKEQLNEKLVKHGSVLLGHLAAMFPQKTEALLSLAGVTSGNFEMLPHGQIQETNPLFDFITENFPSGSPQAEKLKKILKVATNPEALDLIYNIINDNHE